MLMRLLTAPEEREAWPSSASRKLDVLVGSLDDVIGRDVICDVMSLSLFCILDELTARSALVCMTLLLDVSDCMPPACDALLMTVVLCDAVLFDVLWCDVLLPLGTMGDTVSLLA